MKIKVKVLDWDELHELQELVAQEIESRREKRREEALMAARATAQKYRYTLEELLGQKPARKRTFKAKYRNPEDPDQTWTGMGRKPKWVVAALEAGRELDDLRIH